MRLTPVTHLTPLQNTNDDVSDQIGSAVANDILDAQLGELQDNGGSTQSYLPASTSPVVNAGDANIENAPNLDQRGNTRIQEGVIDIGATINYSIIDGAGSACASGASDNSSIFSESTFDIENDLMLSDLADNGGSTQTFLLLAESPAVDAGDPNIETTPEYDQRGSTRISNGVIDIGAVEISSTSESNGSGPVHPIWLALMALLGLRRRK